jgi:hypothetical protein
VRSPPPMPRRSVGQPRSASAWSPRTNRLRGVGAVLRRARLPPEDPQRP